MKILLLSPLTHCSGNYTTVCRLRGHFASSGIPCELTSPDFFTSSDEFMVFVQQTGCNLILAIHAYKSGLLLTGCKVPYIIILGGTDVNECTEDPVKMAAMTKAIIPAKHVVCFGTSLRAKFFEKWPQFKHEDVSVIPQAVETYPSAFCIRSYIKSNILPNPLSQEYQLQVTNQSDELVFQNFLQKQGTGSNFCKMSHDQNILTPTERSRLQNQGNLYYCQEEKENCQKKKSEKENHQRKLSNDKKTQPHDQKEQSHDQRKQSHDQKEQPHDHIKDVCDTLLSPILDKTFDKIETSNDFSDKLDHSVEQIFYNMHSHHHRKWSHDFSGPMINGVMGFAKLGPFQHRFDHGFQSDLQRMIGRRSKNKFEEPLFFTIIGGIRPVKDQLYLVEEFSEWAKKSGRKCNLLVVGPKMDDMYFSLFKEKTKSLQSVIHVPGLSLEDTHAVIRDSFALVNTSLSEGMAISILEAMCLNTTVIARDIPGNRNIVTDGETGLLFQSVQDFFNKADFLLNEREEVMRFTSNAFKYVLENHSIFKEKQAYINLAQRICDIKKDCD